MTCIKSDKRTDTPEATEKDEEFFSGLRVDPPLQR